MNVCVDSREAQAAVLVRAALDMLAGDGSFANDGAGSSRRPTMPTNQELAEWMYSVRGLRGSMFDDDLFADPAWDILLDLYIQRCRGKQVSITSACIAARVPSTTALRWITVLEQRLLVQRVDDPADRRRAFVVLTPTGRVKVEQYLKKAGALSMGAH